MARWLIKEEPSHYSFADLTRERETSWSGIHNPLALRHLRSMKPGEAGLFYHTGSEKAIVGRVRVASHPIPDPADERGSWKVRVSAGPPLARPVTLAELKRDARFHAFDLIRNSRLSVLPVPEAIWRAILELASHDPAPGPLDRASPRAARPSRGDATRASSTGARRRRRPPTGRAGAR